MFTNSCSWIVSSSCSSNVAGNKGAAELGVAEGEDAAVWSHPEHLSRLTCGVGGALPTLSTPALWRKEWAA